MGIMLGFGSTEAREREKIRKAVLGALTTEGKTVRSVLKRWNEKADEYNDLPREDVPQRYTRVFYHSAVGEDPARLVYHHINRDHAMSPDGWAMWKVEEDL